MPDTDVLRESVAAYASETTRLMSAVDRWSPDLPTAEKLAYAERLEAAYKELDVIVKSLRSEVANELVAKNIKNGSFTSMDGNIYTVEVQTRVNRRSVQSEELVKAVEKIASQQERRLDATTGELIGEETARLQAIKQAFRMEPRWTAIKDLGIDDDEYCTKTFETTTKITKAVAL